MKSTMELYKELSIAMLEALKQEAYDEFDLLLEERENIIKSFVKKDEDYYFENLYKELGINNIDLEIRGLLATQIQKTKLEIRDYKVKIQGNNSYNNIRKQNINLFSKKV